MTSRSAGAVPLVKAPVGGVGPAAWGVLLLGVVALLLVLRLEFGAWRGEAIAVDELYFASCAARSLDAGAVPSTGCHDNKAPVIHAVHQLVQGLFGLYPMPAIKAAALLVMAGVVALVGRLAARAGGAAAGVMAAGLALQPLGADVMLVALKTESVGALFMLAGLALLLPAGGREPGALRWLGAGAALAMAVLTKQTYAVVPVAVLCATAFATSPGGPRGSAALRWRVRAVLTRAVLLALGGLLPVVALAALFAANGGAQDLLDSVFLYPAVYGGASDVPRLQRLVWTAGAVFAQLGHVPALPAMAVAGVALWAGREGRDRAQATLWAVAIALLLIPFAAPAFFAYHLLPAWMLLALLGGVAWGQASLAVRRVVGPLLAVLALLAAANAWMGNGGKGQVTVPTEDTRAAQAHPTPGARYGWSLGYWPEFYVHRGLVPASDVLFPWALPGAPPNALFHLPAPGSRLEGWLNQSRSRALARLWADFERMPPDVIALTTPLARAEGSTALSDVPGLDAWIDRHCRPWGESQDNQHRPVRLFDCRRTAPHVLVIP